MYVNFSLISVNFRLKYRNYYHLQKWFYLNRTSVHIICQKSPNKLLSLKNTILYMYTDWEVIAIPPWWLLVIHTVYRGYSRLNPPPPWLLLIYILYTEAIVNWSQSPWWLSVIPLMFLVRINIKVMFLWSTMFIPLFLTVTLYTTVRTVVCAGLDVGWQRYFIVSDGNYWFSSSYSTLFSWCSALLGFFTTLI